MSYFNWIKFSCSTYIQIDFMKILMYFGKKSGNLFIQCIVFHPTLPKTDLCIIPSQLAFFFKCEIVMQLKDDMQILFHLIFPHPQMHKRPMYVSIQLRKEKNIQRCIPCSWVTNPTWPKDWLEKEHNYLHTGYQMRVLTFEHAMQENNHRILGNYKSIA